MEKESIQYHPTVVIASSRDEELAEMRAPLDADLSYEQVDAVVRRALDLDSSPKALRRIISETDWVVIKPNMVTLPWAAQSDVFAGGECTKPEIVVAVAEECLRAGAAEVVVGDGSHAVELPWHLAATLDGAANLAAEMDRLSAEYGGTARVASLEADSPAWVEVPSSTSLGTILVSSPGSALGGGSPRSTSSSTTGPRRTRPVG